MAAAIRSIPRLAPPDTANGSISAAPIPSRFSFRWRKTCRWFCALSMNGCGGDSEAPVSICETRTLAAVSTPAMAMSDLNSAILTMKSDPPSFRSGIIRIQVPILDQLEAISWLHAQHHLPRCFFSGREQRLSIGSSDPSNGNGECHGASPNLLSVAGVGSAVFFQGFRPFGLDDWKCIRRFLSTDCPLIRAYGAMRFDARTNVSPEWEGFGSFYFIVPQVTKSFLCQILFNHYLFYSVVLFPACFLHL